MKKGLSSHTFVSMALCAVTHIGLTSLAGSMVPPLATGKCVIWPFQLVQVLLAIFSGLKFGLELKDGEAFYLK